MKTFLQILGYGLLGSLFLLAYVCDLDLYDLLCLLVISCLALFHKEALFDLPDPVCRLVRMKCRRFFRRLFSRGEDWKQRMNPTLNVD